MELRIEPRWTDLDPQGHVNNSVFLVYSEESRSRFLAAELPTAQGSIVVVRTEVDYLRPVTRGDVAVVLATTVERIGTASLTTSTAITTEAGASCAQVRTVQVKVRDDRSGSCPWTEAERASLLALVPPP